MSSTIYFKKKFTTKIESYELFYVKFISIVPNVLAGNAKPEALPQNLKSRLRKTAHTHFFVPFFIFVFREVIGLKFQKIRVNESNKKTDSVGNYN